MKPRLTRAMIKSLRILADQAAANANMDLTGTDAQRKQANLVLEGVDWINKLCDWTVADRAANQHKRTRWSVK